MDSPRIHLHHSVLLAHHGDHPTLLLLISILVANATLKHLAYVGTTTLCERVFIQPS